jgi:hypothetical protein
MMDRIREKHFEMLSRQAPVTEIKSRIARSWADAICDQLRTSRVSIKWEPSGKALGWFKPSEPDRIFLNPILNQNEIPEVVAHELAHRERHLNRWPDTEALVERDTQDLLQLLAS